MRAITSMRRAGVPCDVVLAASRRSSAFEAKPLSQEHRKRAVSALPGGREIGVRQGRKTAPPPEAHARLVEEREVVVAGLHRHHVARPSALGRGPSRPFGRLWRGSRSAGGCRCGELSVGALRCHPLCRAPIPEDGLRCLHPCALASMGLPELLAHLELFFFLLHWRGPRLPRDCPAVAGPACRVPSPGAAPTHQVAQRSERPQVPVRHGARPLRSEREGMAIATQGPGESPPSL